MKRVELEQNYYEEKMKMLLYSRRGKWTIWTDWTMRSGGQKSNSMDNMDFLDDIVEERKSESMKMKWREISEYLLSPSCLKVNNVHFFFDKVH